ncbi:hypothetical protein AB0B89_23075 [Sphaerisporangium sp. NPDC049002]|uniref:hypothetical protein n=1 Tax=unclassified Sphaerisporangium TaxID=2630420 RepID=UPI0033FF98A7
MVWRGTEFERACVERGWERPSVFLSVFAQAAHMLGEPVTLTDRQFRRWCLPNPPRPRPKAWRVLHAMFGINPADLGFPPAPYGETNPCTFLITDQTEETDVNRRTFVTGAVGATAGVALGSFTAPEAVGMQHVQELRAGLRALRTMGDAHGGSDVRPLAIRHLNRVRRVIETSSYPDSIGRRLRLLAGETASRCAYIHFDASDQETARHYWNEALTIGITLGNDELKTQALAMLGFQANYEKQPRQARDLLAAARQYAETMGSPVLLSIIASREARALSLMGDHSAARAELARAMRLMERPERSRPAPDWTAFYDHSEFEVVQAKLYTECGQHKAAVPYFRASLTHTGASFGRNRAGRQFVLAHSLVRANEVDEGAAIALAALDQLREVSSGQVRHRVVEVRDALARVETASARESAEALTQHLN